MKTERLKYETYGPILTSKIEIWEDGGQLYYSWYYAFSKQRKGENVVKNISLESFNNQIDDLGDTRVFSFREYTFDPVMYSLELVDRYGKKICYSWCDDDNVDSAVVPFLSFVGTMVHDAPFKIWPCSKD